MVLMTPQTLLAKTTSYKKKQKVDKKSTQELKEENEIKLIKE